MTDRVAARPLLPAAPAAALGRRVPWFALGLTLAYGVFVCLQLAQHQMWRDELNAWGLVVASPTLAELHANLRYEGHPGLWHLLLWFASRLSSDPSAMQAVHALIATGVAALIAFGSPFSRIEKLLLLLNFYIAYDYAVVSRNYGIGLLLALAYAQLRATRPDRVLANGAVLGLLANTNVFGLLLSGVLAAEYLHERYRCTARRGGLGGLAAAAGPGAAAYLALVAVAILTMLPAPDISWRTTGRPFSAPHDLYELKRVALAYWEMPLLPALYVLGWQPRSAGLLRQLLDPALLVLPFLLFGVWRVFRRSPNLIFILVTTALASALFGHLVYFGSMRHWGVNFTAFLVVLWMQRRWRPQRSWLVLGILVVGAAAGVGASVRVWKLPFSHAATAAAWIERHQPADVALVGTADTIVAGVAIELGRPIYFLDCSCTGTYLRYQRGRDDFRESQIPARLVRALGELRGRPVLLVLTSPIDPVHQRQLEAAGVRLRPAAKFEGSQVQEDFFLYEVSR